jgi:hypothetical protein
VLLVPDRKNPFKGFELKIEPPTGRGLLTAVLSELPIRTLESRTALTTQTRFGFRLLQSRPADIGRNIVVSPASLAAIMALLDLRGEAKMVFVPQCYSTVTDFARLRG